MNENAVVIRYGPHDRRIFRNELWNRLARANPNASEHVITRTCNGLLRAGFDDSDADWWPYDVPEFGDACTLIFRRMRDYE